MRSSPPPTWLPESWKGKLAAQQAVYEDRAAVDDAVRQLAALPPLDRGKVALQPEQSRIINAVSSMCGKCHDHENDPNFDFFTYWPKVNHTFPKK